MEWIDAVVTAGDMAGFGSNHRAAFDIRPRRSWAWWDRDRTGTLGSRTRIGGRTTSRTFTTFGRNDSIARLLVRTMFPGIAHPAVRWSDVGTGKNSELRKNAGPEATRRCAFA